MDSHSPTPYDRLVDYLILVGPGRGLIFNPHARPHASPPLMTPGSSWHAIHPPQPSILRKFPQEGHDSSALTADVAYFCQPDGCSVELTEQRMHHFMLTDTESNKRTYGICLSFPHLFDPLQGGKGAGESDEDGGAASLVESDGVCIQEWGVLSVCILTHHPFYSFFQKALLSLQHFVDHFFNEDLTWNALIHAGDDDAGRGEEGEGGAGGRPGSPKAAVVEVEKWIAQLLAVTAPQQGQSALEVELEVDPAITVAVPPASRLPLMDLSVSQLFRRLGVCTLIEIFKLVLAEQKVILYSNDVAFVSESVLILLALLYPLQYLFPAIPLLPTSMPTSENLLMVPTPFFIGVHSSFLDKIGATSHPEAWMINLDTKQFEQPTLADQQTIPEFPYCILQLQADIRKVLDYLEREGGVIDWEEDRHSLLSFTTQTADDQPLSLSDEVDVMIRIAFVDFLFSPEILGSTEQYMCIYRLFTRPVVSIKTTAFIHGYQKNCPATNTEFISNLIRSQGIEYFFEWALNPSNSAFSEIRRGIHAVDRLSDRQYHYVHKSGLTIHQVCLYTLSDDSLLYQEMLAYKASHASYCLVSSTDLPSEDDSDWEVLAATQHSSTVELPISSPSYNSEDRASPYSPGPYPTHRLLITSTAADDDDGFLHANSRAFLGSREAEVNVAFHPLPRHLASAEVHEPLHSTPMEVVSTSVRVGGDSYSTPISPLVELRTTAANIPLLYSHASQDPSSLSVRHSHNSSAHHHLPPVQTLQLPPGPRKRIILSEASSDASSCDGDESEPNSDDFESPRPRAVLAPNGPSRRKRRGTNHEFLSLNPQSSLRSRSLSPNPRGSSVDSHSEDDTVLVTRRRVESQHRSFFTLSPSPSMEVVEFSAPFSTSPSNFGRSASMRLPRKRSPSSPLPVVTYSSPSPQYPFTSVSRTVPLSAIIHTQALEYQIQELVQKLLDGQGLPLIKPPALRRMAGYEKTRVMVLRQLETQLGLRRPDELRMATDSQILPVGVPRSVYRGLLDLLKYFLQSIEDELQKEPEASIFSVFLLLRLAFSIFLLPKGRGAGKALPAAQKPLVDHSLSLPSPISMAIDPASLAPGKTVAVSNSPNRSPVPGRKNQAPGAGILSDQQLQRKIAIVAVSARQSLRHRDRAATPVVNTRHLELRGQDEEYWDNSALLPEAAEEAVEVSEEGEGEGEEEEEGSSDNEADSAPTPKVSMDIRDVSVYFTPSATTPQKKVPNPGSRESESHSHSTMSGSSSASRPGSGHTHKPGSPLMAMHRRLRSEADFSNVIGARFSKDTAFLYKDLMKAVGGNKEFMRGRKFWNVLFMSAVTVDRSYLGWNENTAELYQKYNSLLEGHRQAFGAEEDYLLSLVLHNLLVYMLATGMSPGDTTDVIHRLTARTRLATLEEKQLQKTLKLVEQNGSSDLDLSDIGLMSLYSEVHPTVSYIVHYGINMIAPVYKLQITSECLILRRFPDEKISMRLWNDHISAISYSERRATVTISYHDNMGECKHHFHSKEFLKVYEALQILVSVGTILD